MNLKYMDHLREIGKCPIGYSGHERGYSVPVASVARGARIIEKHLTVDRNLEGNDHKVSLLPDEFKLMVDAVRQVEQALGTGGSRTISQGELMNRETLAKSLVINTDLTAGETVTDDMIEVKSPGNGLQPNRRRELVGRPARRDFKAGDFFFPSDLGDGEERVVRARAYRFRRPWGLPVRYHDFQKLAAQSNPDLLEFHMSYKDLEIDVDTIFSGTYDVDFVVHSPELFAGDHVLDLASNDEAYRAQSIRELQRVIDVTRSLKRFFPKTERPLIVLNAGGFSHDGPLPPSSRPKLYERLRQSLAQIDAGGVELIPQTMPPFPWHFGGQQFHNLFMDPADTGAFCKEHGYRLCLDISHSRLACNERRASFQEFLERIAPFAAHMHVVDARGVDGEGLQIGEGDIDFAALADVLDRCAPKASFIPEIWQGHKNDGEGFWIALERLEKHF